eukprot:6544191-Lingulodinium_polyedra.AAC.1
MKREKGKECNSYEQQKEEKEILSLAKEMLAKTLLECLQEGGLLERMAAAGRRMDQQEKESH